MSAESEHAFTTACDGLISAIHVAGDLDQVREDVGDSAGQTATDVVDLKMDVRLVAAQVQPDKAVGVGTTRSRCPAAEDDVVSARHPLLPFEALR